MGDMRKDIFGVDEDDGIFSRAGKGIGDLIASPVALGGAMADYAKAGFNELTGNEDGLQWENTPGFKDVIGDAATTGLAAFTGGTGNAIKTGVGSLAKNGVKNTLGKAKNKILGSTTGKMLLGGPKRQLATGAGVVGALTAPDADTEKEKSSDIASTAPQGDVKPIHEIDLDAPAGSEATAAAPMVNPTIDEPAGPTPGTGEFTAAEQIEVDPKDKSPGAFQRRNIKKALLADASRKVNDTIQQNKVDDRRAASAKNRMDLLEDRYDSTGGRMPGAWAALSPEQKAQMAENYQTNSYYNSADEARKESLEALERSGGSFVDPNDPTNQNKLPGQVSKEEFSKNTGLTQEGTGITQNADGTYNTLETGSAFEDAGGRVFAEPHLNDVQQAALGRQLEGERDIYTDEFGQQSPKTESTVRMTGNRNDYADAGFQSRESALDYLNRGANEVVPVDTKNAPISLPEEEEDDSWDWTDYAKGAGLLTGGLLAARTKPGRAMINKGLTMFSKPGPAIRPPGRNKIFNDAVARNARPGTVKNPGGLGQPGSMQKAPVKPPANPWSSASQNARPRAKTPQDAGFDARIDAMSRPDLVRAVGPRTADGRRVATTEELRRRYKALNRKIF